MNLAPSSSSDEEMAYRGSVPLWRHFTYPHRRVVRRIALYIGVVIMASIILFPLYWIIASSLRPIGEFITRGPELLPAKLTLQHYVDLFTISLFPTYLKNSVIITTGVVVLTTTFATLGGYGLTRIDIPLKRTFARGVLFSYMFPPVLLAIPMFILWNHLGILNTFFGLILAITARVLPFSLWLMWRFFLTVPYTLEESAQMAGATRFQAFKDIALPNAKPGVIAVAILAFAFAWGDFTMAWILMSELQKFPITVGIERTFFAGGQIDWGLVLAGSSIALIPPLLFVYFLEKYYIRGFSPGGTL